MLRYGDIPLDLHQRTPAAIKAGLVNELIYRDTIMPVPLLYPQGTKGSFNTPRTPPLPPKYSPPVLSRSKSAMGYPESRRGNRLAWMSDTVRNHVIAVVGEFVGTTFFLFFALAAAQTANAKPDNLPAAGAVSMPGSLSLLQILYISFGFGLSLAVNAWVFFRISGGMFNPAVGLLDSARRPWLNFHRSQ